ncbi:MAG TPA: hypothetical protein VFW15_01010, partial [Thermoanaerobaculia bacterium]|nr:hypothetical protein [Thermoanaerobaculia bacterium]
MTGRSARETRAASLVPVHRAAARFAVSAPIATIRVPPRPFVGEREMREPVRRRSLRRGADTSDPVVQSALPPIAIPSPITTFEGLNNQDNASVLGLYIVPPDTNGDVGPNHYVQTVNLLFRVYNKSGTALTAPLPMSALFASLGGICSTQDDGDPIVLYDPLADRWLLSQFAVATPAHQCVALSRSGDPAGSYFLYDFVMPNSKFNDYPKFGVWPDAYYMSDNQFDPNFQGAGVFAFERSKMLAGDPSASY